MLPRDKCARVSSPRVNRNDPRLKWGHFSVIFTCDVSILIVFYCRFLFPIHTIL